MNHLAGGENGPYVAHAHVALGHPFKRMPPKHQLPDDGKRITPAAGFIE
jgi:hypothetical protein